MEWFPDKEAAIFTAFLERWPTLTHAQRARCETLEAFFGGERPARVEHREAQPGH